MATITRHVLTEADRLVLEADILAAYARTSTKADLQTAVTPPTGVWPVAAFLEAYDDMLVQGTIHEFREVA